MSAVFTLDNCLLWCNPDLYRTISGYFVLVLLSLVLLAVDRHSSKSNGFVMSSDLLRSASMESSPIKTVSVKLEIVIQEWRKRLFLFALLTWLGCQWSDLRRKPQQHNLPSIFYQNEDGNFCLRCCHRSSLFFHCHSGWCQLIVCVTHPASVTCVTRGASVRWLHFLLFFCKLFIACFVVVLDVLVAGDLRHEHAQSTWGFPFRGPPGYWLRLLHLRCSNWCSFDDDCSCKMSIVVIFTTSSWHLCCICWQGCLVAPMLIATALLIALGECSSCERFGASQWWRRLHPLRSVMASIVPIAIGDGVVACCCLSQLWLVPTLASCSQLDY